MSAILGDTKCAKIAVQHPTWAGDWPVDRAGGGARITRERFSLALGNTCQSVSRILTRRVILSIRLAASNSSNRGIR